MVAYAAERSRLLQAAAWNCFVARRGTNADAGRTKQRENQLAMLELRRLRIVKGAPPAQTEAPRVTLTIAHSFDARYAGRFWRYDLPDTEGPGMRAAWDKMPIDLRGELMASGYDADRLNRLVLGEVHAMNARGLGLRVAGVTVSIDSLALCAA
jgi:hypothetical protein